MTGCTLKGAIFDLDGVITATAQSHFRAWKATFEGFLKETGREENPVFTYEEDYIPYVDGKPRYNGVQSFLQSRGIDLPWGNPSDEPGNDTVCAVGNSKNDAFRETVRKDGVEIYDSTLRLIHELIERGVKVGVASSSKNTGFVLKTVGLSDLFGSVVDGVVSAELGLRGKPEPDIFILAAKRLGLTPKECMMVEDAYAGVEAGVKGNFALVLGVNREGGPEGLYARGADMVVADLEEINYRTLEEWFARGIEKSSWRLDYYAFNREEEGLREVLTTVGNGYIGSRGAFVGASIIEGVHYPGTYIAGLYNRLGTEVEGETVYNNDFVNCPNWLRVDLFTRGEKPLSPLDHDVVSWHHWVDFREAVTRHDIVFRDKEKRETRLITERFISMDNPHIACLRYSVTPLNYSGSLSIRSSLDAKVFNYGVERYRPLRNTHFGKRDVQIVDGDIRLTSVTTQSGVAVSMRAHHRFHSLEGGEGDLSTEITKDDASISTVFSFRAVEGQSFTMEKIVWIATDRDWPIEQVERPELPTLTYEDLLKKHKKRWEILWERGDIVISGNRFSQRTARLHMYHLLTTASAHNADMDTGLPARGLHGEAYRGHVFWDELFIAPLFNRVLPEVTHSHLLYRYRRLKEAKKIAAEAGYEGALYPWQSADTGERESQELHYNPVSGEWDADLSRLQWHISLAIAHNVWEYFYTTGDRGFMEKYGREMLIEIARFWASAAEFDKKDGKYHIRGVMGPDEFHERYHNAPESGGGVKDNAYTNVMAAWLLDKVVSELDLLCGRSKGEILKRCSINSEEPRQWKEIASKLAVTMDQQGIISQFDGYRELKELDWEAYREKYGDISRMDRILKAENDSPDYYKIAKQADVLMIWYLFSPEEAARILRMMGCTVESPYTLLEENYEYYINRTSHGSTLSYAVHAAILTHLPGRKKETRQWFDESMKSDIYDTQGGTTPEGIHCGVMAGTLKIIVDNFAGLRIRPEEMEINPDLPSEWEGVSFGLTFRGRNFSIAIVKTDSGRPEVSVTEKIGEKAGSPGEAMLLKVGGELKKIGQHHK